MKGYRPPQKKIPKKSSLFTIQKAVWSIPAVNIIDRKHQLLCHAWLKLQNKAFDKLKNVQC